MARDLYDELNGTDDLGDLLDGDVELGNVFKALGKVAKAVAKPALGIAKGIPGIGMAVSVAEGGAKAIAGAAKGKKKPAAKKVSVASLAKKAKTGVKVSKPSSGVAVPGGAGTVGATPVIVATAKPLDVARVAAIFKAQVSPQLAAIGSQLQQHNLQAQITSEHRGRAARALFERKVLAATRARANAGR